MPKTSLNFDSLEDAFHAFYLYKTGDFIDELTTANVTSALAFLKKYDFEADIIAAYSTRDLGSASNMNGLITCAKSLSCSLIDRSKICTDIFQYCIQHDVFKIDDSSSLYEPFSQLRFHEFEIQELVQWHESNDVSIDEWHRELLQQTTPAVLKRFITNQLQESSTDTLAFCLRNSLFEHEPVHVFIGVAEFSHSGFTYNTSPRPIHHGEVLAEYNLDSEEYAEYFEELSVEEVLYTQYNERIGNDTLVIHGTSFLESCARDVEFLHSALLDGCQLSNIERQIDNIIEMNGTSEDTKSSSQYLALDQEIENFSEVYEKTKDTYTIDELTSRFEKFSLISSSITSETFLKFLDQLRNSRTQLSCARL